MRSVEVRLVQRPQSDSDVRLLHPSSSAAMAARPHLTERPLHRFHTRSVSSPWREPLALWKHFSNVFCGSGGAEKSRTMSFTLSGIMGSVGFGRGVLELDCTAAASIQSSLTSSQTLWKLDEDLKTNSKFTAEG